VQASASSVGRTTRVCRSDASPQAPFAAVEVDVADARGGIVLAGLATASGDHVAATYDADRRRVAISVRRAGRVRLVRKKKVNLPTAFRFAFAVCENQVTALVDTGDGWQPLLTERDRVAALVDLRRPEVLGDFSYAWGSPPAKPATLGDVRAGLFGMTGVRDPHLV
jgi:hypothetical protein